MRLVLLLLSILANVALGTVALVTRTNWFSSTLSIPSPVRVGDGSEERPPSGLSSSIMDDGAVPARPHDLAELVAWLRAQEFPASMLRVAVSALVRNELEPRHAAAAAEQQLRRPYWKLQFAPDPESARALRSLKREERTRVAELLGTELYDEETLARKRQRFGDLSFEKLCRVDASFNDYGDQVAEVQLVTQGVLLIEDREKLARLEEQRDAELASVLSPAEFEEYHLRNSRDAAMLRQHLVGFAPTEDEFRALFSLQLDRRTKRRATPHGTVEGFDPRQDFGFSDAELQAILSAKRLAEYRQATDPANRIVYEVARRFNLSSETVNEVIALRKKAAYEAESLHTARDLTTLQRADALEELTKQTASHLKEVLGPRGFEAYRRANGSFLSQL